jgi:hypothetical protein
VASGNAYYEMQDSLAHPNALPRSSGPMGWVVRGPWAVTQLADLMYSSNQAPFPEHGKATALRTVSFSSSGSATRSSRPTMPAPLRP